METESNHTETICIEPLVEIAEAYGKTSVELLGLKSIELTARLVSMLVFRSAVVLCIAICLMTVNFGVAYWLGDMLGKVHYGFLCVALFYGVLGLIIAYFMRNWITKRISNSIINNLLN